MNAAPAGTLPQLLLARAGRAGDAAALREKKYGIWQEITWRQYADHVRAACLGLVQLGLETGDHVAVVSGNRPAWLYVELAAQSAGAVPFGVLVDSTADQLRFALEHGEARFAVVEDQEQADKILSMRGALPRLERIVVDDMRGLEAYRDPAVMSLAELSELGQKLDAREPRRYDDLVGRIAPDDVALLAYTSGTAGGSTAAMLSHRNLLTMAAGVMTVDAVRESDEIFSFLPFAGVGEQLISVAIALSAGATVSFPEEPETTRDDLREIGPQVIIAPPRFWEAICAESRAKIADSGTLKRAATRTAMALGARASIRRRGSAAGAVLHAVAHVLALRAMLDKLGLSRVRRAYSAGARLDPDVLGFFRSLGLNLKQVYGQAETSGICVLHRDADVRAETVGTPTPGTRVRISAHGEVLVQTESNFVGYYKDPEATRNALEDGWLRTGDAGLLDAGGHLVIIDRLEDVLRLADGARVSAAVIEDRLERSPHVRGAVAVGDDRPHVAALVHVDMATVGPWAEANRLSFTTFEDLSQKREVSALIAEAVARANEDLPPAARIGAFAVLDGALDAEEPMRTRAARRAAIAAKYKDMIEDLYAPRDRGRPA